MRSRLEAPGATRPATGAVASDVRTTPLNLAIRSDGGDEIAKAMERAGRWLALRPRTEKELGDRLVQGGFERHVVARVVDRLRELRLVDDAAFARQWIEERSKKGRSARVLANELADKGIDTGVIEAALAQAAPDEDAQATEVAARLLKRLGGGTLEQQAARLYQGLARRGFSEDAAQVAVRAVLPPEGWD